MAKTILAQYPFMFGNEKANLVVTENGFYVESETVMIIDASTSFRSPFAPIDLPECEKGNLTVDIDGRKNTASIAFYAKGE